MPFMSKCLHYIDFNAQITFALINQLKQLDVRKNLDAKTISNLINRQVSINQSLLHGYQFLGLLIHWTASSAR